jgi:hypothetical protein
MNRTTGICDKGKFSLAFKIALITYVILAVWLIVWVWVLPGSNYG